MSEAEIQILRDEINKLNIKLTEVGTDVNWIKKFFWAVVPTLIANSIGLAFMILQGHFK